MLQREDFRKPLRRMRGPVGKADGFDAPVGLVKIRLVVPVQEVGSHLMAVVAGVNVVLGGRLNHDPTPLAKARRGVPLCLNGRSTLDAVPLPPGDGEFFGQALRIEN
jgi:hypothetical protein